MTFFKVQKAGNEGFGKSELNRKQVFSEVLTFSPPRMENDRLRSAGGSPFR